VIGRKSKKAASPHPPGYRPVENVKWGKGALPLKLAQGVQRSSEPKWYRPKSLGDRLPRWWLVAGCLAAVAGLLIGRGLIPQSRVWPILTESHGVVYYGGQALSNVTTGTTSVWTGAITVAISTTNDTVASVLDVGTQRIDTVCRPYAGTGITTAVTEQCVVTIHQGKTNTVYTTHDVESGNGRCWERIIYENSPLEQSVGTVASCESGVANLLPWALPSGIVGQPFSFQVP
jgi:hypothetical protein